MSRRKKFPRRRGFLVEWLQLVGTTLEKQVMQFCRHESREGFKQLLQWTDNCICEICILAMPLVHQKYVLYYFCYLPDISHPLVHQNGCFLISVICQAWYIPWFIKMGALLFLLFTRREPSPGSSKWVFLLFIVSYQAWPIPWFIKVDAFFTFISHSNLFITASLSTRFNRE